MTKCLEHLWDNLLGLVKFLFTRVGMAEGGIAEGGIQEMNVGGLGRLE